MQEKENKIQNLCDKNLNNLGKKRTKLIIH